VISNYENKLKRNIQKLKILLNVSLLLVLTGSEYQVLNSHRNTISQ